jgi:hypothetical protein
VLKNKQFTAIYASKPHRAKANYESPALDNTPPLELGQLAFEIVLVAGQIAAGEIRLKKRQ